MSATNTPTLALCIPAYNAATYLPRLLESAAGQTVPFDEMWVYDDCSTDATGEVAARHGAKVVRGDTNRGCSYGKNALAERTTCDWIHFHDADDALLPNFVEHAHDWTARADAPDVVLFSYEYRDGETDGLICVRDFNDKELRRDAVAYTIREQINPFCGLYRRQSFMRAGGYDLDPLVLYNEDVAMHCRLARAGLNFAADPAVTIINYRYGGSMSAANRVKCFRAQYHVMRKAAELSGRAYAAEIGGKLWEIARVIAAYKDWETVDACIRLALELGSRVPEDEKPLFRLACRFNPRLAMRGREHLISLFKPHLRATSYASRPVSSEQAGVANVAAS